MTSKFTVNSYNIISVWNYIVPKNNDCTICSNNINVPSLYNDKGTDSSILTGFCGHSYHKDCIDTWNQYQKHCPICAEPWKV